MIVFDADELIARWVGKRVGIDDFGPMSALGVSRNGKLLAGAVFNNYRHPGIEVTFAADSPRWATKEAISCILAYPFVQLGCLRLTAFTGAKNERARTFLSGLGFEQEGYHPYGFPDDDAVSYGMYRDKCRWVVNEIRAKAARSA